ncbi:9159_t:CDS:2, partial [Dentiscutata heterogama]
MSTNAFLTGLRSTCSAERIGYELFEVFKKASILHTLDREFKCFANKKMRTAKRMFSIQELRSRLLMDASMNFRDSMTSFATLHED